MAPLITKLEKSQKFCENLQGSLEKRINECQSLKRENKQSSLRKSQLEKKVTEIETMAMELKKQKADLLQNKENSEKKSSEMIVTLNRENDTVFASFVYLLFFKIFWKLHKCSRISGFIMKLIFKKKKIVIYNIC